VDKSELIVILCYCVAGLGSLAGILLGVYSFIIAQLWKRQNHMADKQDKTDEKVNIIYGEHRRNHKSK
jgi:hypothetical protein